MIYGELAISDFMPCDRKGNIQPEVLEYVDSNFVFTFLLIVVAILSNKLKILYVIHIYFISRIILLNKKWLNVHFGHI